ncbi:S8 family serine peptidase [Kitasatospora herbaricolor]|uniref:S8 family serine peptidase n=1 Tax=Kitasatospora herbaricolor TaxID=68217 RepID=A0ABZ1W0S5_9ACTN|nr:S8 family serine peptidase [Kitasatospora herbaricolor]
MRRRRPAAVALICSALLTPAAAAGAAAQGVEGAPAVAAATGAPGGSVPAVPAVPAGPAASSGGADPMSLPVIGQGTGAARSEGCTKPSDKGTERTPWAQTVLRPEAAWQLSRGAGVTVAVVGSGVDAASGVLDGRLALGPREYGPGDAGRDCVGHGTFLAGLIAARRQDGTGFAGIAPEARILAVAVTDEAGITTPALLARGIRDAADGGARVIAVAVPVPVGGEDLAGAVRYAGERGALVVAPAGPDATGSGTSGGQAFPAAYPEVLAVAGLSPNGAVSNGAASSGSVSNGAGANGGGSNGGAAGTEAAGPGGRVDLVAPGDALMSVGPGGKGYFTGSGPSFATAVVAGTAALVLGYRPELTAAQLLDRLKATAYHPGTVLPDARLGYGTVDPLAAVSAVLPGARDGAAAPPPARAGTAVAAVEPPVARPADGQAVAVAGGVLGGVALLAGLGYVLKHGRRRGWQPGRWTS